MRRALSCGLAVLFLTRCGPAAVDEARRGGGLHVDLGLAPQHPPTDALLQAVSAVSPDVVWVSGHQGTFLRTTDGGDTWLAGVGPGGDTLQFRDVAAFDVATAYLMSAGEGARSRIYRTDDGGASWRLQYMADHPNAFLDCMDFWDRDHGLAYGDAVDGIPFVLRTGDGGATWSRVSPEGLPPALEGEGGFAASGTCLATGPEGRAWIATGNGARARVLRTTDYAATWTAVDVPVAGGEGAGLTTVHFGERGVGAALGGVIGGDTLRTPNAAVSRDGGLTWTAAESTAMTGPVYGSALVVEAPGALVLVAVGPGGLDWSADLGRTWSHADTLSYWGVDFAGPTAGWAVGPGGRITRLALHRP